MRRSSTLFSTTILAIACIVLCFASASAQQGSGLSGSWQTKGSELVVRVTFNPDGTGALDGTPIKYSVRGTQLTVNEEGTINNYTFKLSGDELVVSGGDLDAPMTFVRQGTGKGLGRRQSQAGVDPQNGQKNSETEKKETGLVGRWQSSEDTVQLKDDGTAVLNIGTYRYAVKGNTITLANNEGAMQFPFELSGDTLRVMVDGRTVIYKRLHGGQSEESVGSAAGSNPADLSGKWCYMANVNSGSGGRISNRCFTLYANGTYEYYSETSSSGPIASSASQESDNGTWTATATSITRNSRSLGTETYPLEKRNHPKTGDPMLVIDGDAYVTYSPRSPWP
ncbi:MAG: hypothetical protein ABR556_12535 [Pyrinomonadaceae bacterium]